LIPCVAALPAIPLLAGRILLFLANSVEEPDADILAGAVG
jgi:hypothetical protein